MLGKFWGLPLFTFTASLLASVSFAGTISGKVADQNGKPVEGALIKIERREVKGRYQIRTTKQGSYFYAGLPNGTYDISVEIDGRVIDRRSNQRVRGSVTTNFKLRGVRQRQPAQAPLTRSSGKKVKAKVVKTKNVNELRLVVAGEPGATRLIPGKSVSYDVVVLDKKGTRYSLAKGTLSPKNLRIKPELMTITSPFAHPLVVTPEADRAKVGQSNYGLTVQYGSTKRPVTIRQEFIPDFGAIYGPEPADVQGLKFSLKGNEDDSFLVPGKSLGLSVVVTDKDGREYRNSKPFPKVPISRLEVETELVDWNPANQTLTPHMDQARVRGNRYEISVQYQGRADTKQTREFIPDFAALLGPEPDDVESLDIDIEGLSGSGLVTPGSRVRLNVRVKDKNGRTFSTLGKEGRKIPPDRIEVATSHMRYSASSSTLQASTLVEEMVGETYEVTVSYR
ncbi:MAG: carboxypeptidase-like regulatory domain-containing protein, partial [Planctomycetota bacterium]